MARRDWWITAGFVLWFGVTGAGCYEVTKTAEPRAQNEQEQSRGGTGGDRDSGSECGRMCGNHTFTGVVWDAVTDEPVPGMTVVALSNDTSFEKLTYEATTADDGSFVFKNLEPGLMCIKVVGTEGEDRRVDTFTCNVTTNEQNRVVVSTPYSVARAINEPVIHHDPTLANLSGAVLYINNEGTEIPVDCATVEIVGANDKGMVYYFAGALPDATRTKTDATGRFIAINLTPGMINLNAIVNGEVIGSVSVPIQNPVDSTGGEFNSNIVRLYADQAEDPTPDCPE